MTNLAPDNIADAPDVPVAAPANEKPIPTTKTILRGLARRAILLVVLAYVAYGVFLMLYQTKLIYHPQKYGEIDPARLAPGTVFLRYDTTQGKQLAFYVPHKAALDATTSATASPLPETLWVCFHGNASVALHWMNIVRETTSTQAAFLLIDYPGYGQCEGRPTRANIIESSQKAYAALATHLKTTPEQLDPRLNILGLSIGSATGLDFAVTRPTNPQRIILIAPFTTMKEMARRVVGRVLSVFLTERFDNPARLAEIARRMPTPKAYLFHGVKDDLVPVAMSQSMANTIPGTTLRLVPEADHNNILTQTQPEIIQILNAPNP